MLNVQTIGGRKRALTARAAGLAAWKTLLKKSLKHRNHWPVDWYSLYFEDSLVRGAGVGKRV